jgi:hypothetical protein
VSEPGAALRGLAGWAWLAPPWVAGALLRCWNLREQVIAGDELHAVRFARSMTVPEILTTFGVRTDHCLPLTALDRWFVDLGGHFSEALLRGPVLAFGLAFLCLVPLALARTHGARVAAGFAWLAAVSPGLVAYSRIARSYMPMVALSTGALLALVHAWGKRSRRGWLLWGLLAAAALWFNPVAAPFVLAPPLLVVAQVVVARPREARARALEVVAALAWLGAVAGGLLLPALPSLFGAVAGRAGGGRSSAGEWWLAARMLVGSRSSVVGAVALVAAIAGGTVLARRARFAVAASTLAVAAQVAALLLVRPHGLGDPLVLSRYLLPILPVLLLGVAAALDAALSRLGSARASSAIWAPLALAVLLLAAGPLPGRLRAGSSLELDSESLRFDRPATAAQAPELPRAYLSAPVRGARVVLEAPFVEQWDTTRSVWLADRRQRKVVRLGTLFVQTLGRTARFRTLVGLTPRQVLASDADVLVFHRDVLRDEQRAATILLGREPPRTHGPTELRRLAALREGSPELSRRFRRAFGRPDYRDAGHLVWDLDRVRRRREARPSDPAGRAALR